jgi:hypothetical protein
MTSNISNIREFLRLYGIEPDSFISVASALSLKNAVVDRLNSIMKLIEEENQQVGENQRSSHMLSEYDRYIETKDFLVSLKEGIAKANSTVGSKGVSNISIIFAMEELQDHIAKLEKIPTKQGSHYTNVGDYSDSSVELVYSSELSKSWVAEEVVKQKMAYARLQQDLAANNAELEVLVYLPKENLVPS